MEASKKDFKGWTLSEMPNDVVEALVVCYVGQPVGRDMYDRVKATMAKYPEFFTHYAKGHPK